MESPCPRCGSTKVIPGLPLYADVRGMEVGGTNIVDVRLHGVQRFWKSDVFHGGLSAKVCGECGHAELHVADAPFLFEQYQKLQQT